jgi:hypothetical protein
MKSIVGLTGIVLMGLGVTTLLFDLRTGICAGIILLGMGLCVDALGK